MERCKGCIHENQYDLYACKECGLDDENNYKEAQQ